MMLGNVDYTKVLQGNSEEVVLRVLADQQLAMAERAKANAILNFLNALDQWKQNTEQRIAYGLPVDAPPAPPVGYTLPPAPPPPAPVVRTVIQPKNQFGIYPGPGDTNPAGMVATNPYGPGTVRKVVQETPFGASHYWVD